VNENRNSNTTFKWIGLVGLIAGLIIALASAFFFDANLKGLAVGFALLLVGGFIFAKA